MMNTSRSGSRIRQRPQNDAVDDAENRGVRADAERQRQHRDERVTWILSKVPERKDEVLSHDDG